MVFSFVFTTAFLFNFCGRSSPYILDLAYFICICQALFALTGSLVALCIDSDIQAVSPSHQLWVPRKPWRLTTLLWIHTVDIIGDRVSGIINTISNSSNIMFNVTKSWPTL